MTHGEGDLACVYAAHVLRNETGASRVRIRTVDTDLLAIGLLHSFQGLYIHTHFRDKHDVFDMHVLARIIVTDMQMSVDAFVALCVLRGTDFSSATIRGIADWNVYMLALRGARESDVQSLSRRILSYAPKRAKLHPSADFRKSQWVMQYWRNTVKCT
jgi:hypothetical protein